MTHWLPALYVITQFGADGQLQGLRWPYGKGAHATFYGMAKRRDAKWDKQFWSFADPVAAQQVLNEIRKRHPDWAVVSQSDGDDPAHVLDQITISTWPTTDGSAACLIPFPLPRSTSTSVIKKATDIRRVLLSGVSGSRVALLHGLAESIKEIVVDLRSQGALLTGSLATAWCMGPASSGRALSISASGWAIQLRADLHDPAHYLIKPKDVTTWNGVAAGDPPRVLPWLGTLSITRKDWAEWKARLNDAGLVIEGDDPDGQDVDPVDFDTSSVCGWLEPARNGHLLHTYQKEGARFCASHHMRALIGDEMGVGKTAQAIAAADACAVPRIVVVCPVNARYVWEREIEGWSSGGAIQHLTSKLERLDPNARWHIVNYEVLTPRSQSWDLNDAEEEAAYLAVLPRGKKKITGRTFPKRVTVESVPRATPQFTDPLRVEAWNTMVQRLDSGLVEQIAGTGDLLLILDEAHRVKNRDSKRSKTIARIVSAGCRLLLLTGTPLRNHEHEAAALLSLLDPRAAQDLAIDKGYTVQDVKDYLNYFMIRRTKEEVLPELPPKTRQRVDIDELDPDAEAAYRIAIDDACLAHIHALSIGKSEAEARQSAQGHIESARKWLGVAKVAGGVVSDVITDVVESKGSCVVFTAHHLVSDKLLEQLGLVDIRAAVVDGRTPPKERARIVSEFQAGKLDVFIGGINAAGEAITLTRSDTVIFVELDWVPAALLQAEDRIHRVGQQRNCHILHLVARCDGFNLDDELVSVVGAKLARIGAVLSEGTDNIVQAEGTAKAEVLARMLARDTRGAFAPTPATTSCT